MIERILGVLNQFWSENSIVIVMTVISICIILISLKIISVYIKKKQIEKIKKNIRKSVLRSTSKQNKIILNKNKSTFTGKEFNTFRRLFIKNIYYGMDKYGRCNGATGKVTLRKINKMKKSKRKSITHIKLQGWQKNELEAIQIYNRCHCISYIFEGDNKKHNLFVGTRLLNEEMILTENIIRKYIEKTKKAVIYRVIPIYVRSNLIPEGVHIEVASIHDQGKSFSMNQYIFNRQENVNINYLTGEYRIANKKNRKL